VNSFDDIEPPRPPSGIPTDGHAAGALVENKVGAELSNQLPSVPSRPSLPTGNPLSSVPTSNPVSSVPTSNPISSMPPTGNPVTGNGGSEPPRSTSVGKFVFTVDGHEIGTFTEVSGLSVQIDVEDLVEGGQNQYTHKLPKGMKWPNLVLKRGVTDTDNLFEWFAKSSGEGFSGAGNKIEFHTGAVELRDSSGSTVRKWSFVDAYPVKWTGPKLAASSNDVAVEELEICHHGFTTKV
jgi:phage tail-like protein